MATNQVIYPHAIDLDGGTNVITQMTDVTPASNMQDAVEYSAGEPAPSMAFSEFAIPDITFTTRQIKRLLDVIDSGNGQLGVTAALNAGDVDLWYKAGKRHGVRAAGTVNYRGRLTQNAMVYLNSITADQGASAEINARLLPVWDGVNQPLIWTKDEAVGFPAALVEHVYTLGPISIGGATLRGVQGMSIDYGVTPEEVGDAGSDFITYGAVNTFEPTITIRLRDADLEGYDMDGFSAANTVVYLRKRAQDGINVAPATAEHIQLTAAAGTGKWRQVSGLEGTTELFIQTTQSGAGASPIAITSTATALP